MIIESGLVAAGKALVAAQAMEQGKSLLADAAKDRMIGIVVSHKFKRFKAFLEALAADGATEEQIGAYLSDDAQSANFEKIADAVIKSGSQISRLALSRVLGDQIRGGGKYQDYEILSAIDALADLNDVESRFLIAWVAIRKAYNAEKTMPEALLYPHLTPMRLDWSEVEQNRAIFPESIKSPVDVEAVQNRLIRRGLVNAPRTKTLEDIGGSSPSIGEFGLKLAEELTAAAGACGYVVPQIS